MLRIRTVKPELASHEGMFELEQETGLPMRFAWCMMFCVCDREGRFVWRPRTLKTYVLPYDEIDFSRVLDAWVTRGFIRRYRVGDAWYGEIPTFTRHQSINHRESPSELPSIDEADEVFQALTDASVTREARVSHASSTGESRVGHAARGEGKGREGNTRASRVELIPVEGLDAAAWERWVAYRANIRKPLKPASHQAAMTAVARYGAQQSAVVDQSISNGWQGLFDLKPGATTTANAKPAKPPMPPMFIDGVFNLEHKAWAEKWA